MSKKSPQDETVTMGQLARELRVSRQCIDQHRTALKLGIPVGGIGKTRPAIWLLSRADAQKIAQRIKKKTTE